MLNLKKYLFAILTAFIFISCEKTGPLGPEENEVLDGPMEGLSSAEKIRFIKGDEAFGEVFTAETGLGPIFVANQSAGYKILFQ